jgi:hypothetical protein
VGGWVYLNLTNFPLQMLTGDIVEQALSLYRALHKWWRDKSHGWSFRFHVYCVFSVLIQCEISIKVYENDSPGTVVFLYLNTIFLDKAQYRHAITRR